MWQENAADAPSARVCGMDPPRSGGGVNQAIHGPCGGKEARKYETRLELFGRPRQLWAPSGHSGSRDGRLLDRGYACRVEAITGGREGRYRETCAPLWSGPPVVERWRGRLCSPLWDGRGGAQESNWMHAGDTCGVSGRGDVCGPIQLGSPALRNLGEMQKENSASVEDRAGVDLCVS